jgi:hypothetical protein
MYLPQLFDIGNDVQRDTVYFKGLNRRDIIDDNEISSCKNMQMDSFPAIEVRPKRNILANYVNAQALFAGVKRALVDGTNFYYDGVIKGTVTAGAKSMCDFNGKVLIFPDKKYYDYVAGTFGNLWTGEVAPVYPATGSVPDIDFVAVHMNRVFGIKGSNIYACASGDATKWVDFSGDQLDSWAGDVYSEGAFTGIIAYESRLVLVKDDYTYEMLGSYPAQFQTYETAKSGIIDGRSLVEIDGILYGLSREGVKVYTGSKWENISRNLDENYVGGAAGTDGRKYWISLNTGAGGYKLYVFDTEIKQWTQEDTLQVIDFAKLDGEVFALSSAGDLIQFNAGTTEEITWEVISKNYTEDAFEKKYYSRLILRIDLATGSTATVYVRTDLGSWVSVKALTVGTFSTQKVIIAMSRCDSFQVKVAGTGYTKLYGIRREFMVGSEE